MSKPCRNCGGTERYASGGCKSCVKRRALAAQKNGARNKQKRAWARKWREEHLEDAREIERLRRSRYAEKVREGNRRFKRNNPDYWKQKQKEEKYLESKRLAYRRWRANHPDIVREASRNWRIAHPEATQANNQRRRAWHKNAEGTHTGEQRIGRFVVYGGICWICQRNPATHIDHVFALCNGGSNWSANLRPACSKCNGAKGRWEMTGKKTLREITEWVIKRRDFGLPWPIKK